MILEFQNINGTLIAYSNQCKTFMGKQLEKGIVKLKEADTTVGSKSMLKTWRMWMQEIANHMAHSGRTVPIYYDENGVPHGTRPFNKDDAHAGFTAMFLGQNEKGDRYSWSLSSDGGVTVAPKELRLSAMDRFVQYAAEQLIPITIPRQGDYSDYKEMQEQ